MKTNIDFIDHVYVWYLEQLDSIFTQDKYAHESWITLKERERREENLRYVIVAI